MKIKEILVCIVIMIVGLYIALAINQLLGVLILGSITIVVIKRITGVERKNTIGDTIVDVAYIIWGGILFQNASAFFK